MRLASLVSPVATRIATAAVALAVTISGFAFAPSTPAGAATTYAPARQQATPFLSLPFAATERMSVLSGWYYSSSGGFHGGIDYVNGNVNGVGSWQTFPVIASADGEACANCCSRQGNAVFIKHNVNGTTYYTYYGHLASISKDIPVGSQSRTISVKRGQFLGWAGDTGAKGALHLHFALMNANSTPIDPYSIGRLRQYYPDPDTNFPGVGWFMGK